MIVWTRVGYRDLALCEVRGATDARMSLPDLLITWAELHPLR
jgi:hypothetical protein